MNKISTIQRLVKPKILLFKNTVSCTGKINKISTIQRLVKQKYLVFRNNVRDNVLCGTSRKIKKGEIAITADKNGGFSGLQISVGILSKSADSDKLHSLPKCHVFSHQQT
jgi:hypothetical protein